MGATLSKSFNDGLQAWRLKQSNRS